MRKSLYGVSMVAYVISINDYCYIDDFYKKFDSYNLYFYDTETEILYYFHNNI